MAYMRFNHPRGQYKLARIKPIWKFLFKQQLPSRKKIVYYKSICSSDDYKKTANMDEEVDDIMVQELENKKKEKAKEYLS